MDDIFPCLGSLGFFVLLFGFIGVMRYLRYRETLALAEKGLVRAERIRSNGKDTLRWGIVITAIGLALAIGMYPLGFWIDSAGQLPLRFGPWMLVGLIPMFFGIGLILIYVLTRDEARADQEAEAQIEGPRPPPATP